MTTPENLPIGYCGTDPAASLPVWVRTRLVARKCEHCGGKTLLDPTGLRSCRAEMAKLGVGVKVLCHVCGAQGAEETGGMGPYWIPPATDANNN